MLLFEFLIKLTTRENQIVLDPFMGSGTTAVAAKNLGRKFIGFEVNKKYYEDSLERLKEKHSIYPQKVKQEQIALFDIKEKYLRTVKKNSKKKKS